MNDLHDEWNRPSSCTRMGTRSGGSIGIPSTSIQWTPMPRVGRNRRRRIAFTVAEALAMRLALVRIVTATRDNANRSEDGNVSSMVCVVDTAAAFITWHMGQGHANVRWQKHPEIRRTTRPARAGRRLFVRNVRLAGQ